MTISPYSFQQLLNASIHAEEAYDDSRSDDLNSFIKKIISFTKSQTEGLILVEDDNQPWIGVVEEIAEVLKEYKEDDDRDLMTYLCDVVNEYAEISKKELSYAEETGIDKIYHSAGVWHSTTSEIEL